MKISIITPTHNRSEYIDMMLQSVISQKFIGQTIESLVVDNGSKDRTKDVVESYYGKHPAINLRYVYEKNLGCNYARNTGIDESTGDWLIFFDDDVILHEGCIQAYIDAFAKYPDMLCFGGRIKLKQPDFTLPDWLVTTGEYMRSMIVLSLDYGNGNALYDLSGQTPMTVNMAVRRTAFERYGYFSTYFGLSGKKLMPGADYELFSRFSASISKWVYVGGAAVWHPLKKSQATKKYFRQRMFGVGRVTYRLQKFEAKFTIFGLPLYFFTFIAKNLWLWLKFSMLRKPVEKFYYHTEMLTYFGCVYEHFYKKLVAGEVESYKKRDTAS